MLFVCFTVGDHIWFLRFCGKMVATAEKIWSWLGFHFESSKYHLLFVIASAGTQLYSINSSLDICKWIKELKEDTSYNNKNTHSCSFFLFILFLNKDDWFMSNEDNSSPTGIKMYMQVCDFMIGMIATHSEKR